MDQIMIARRYLAVLLCCASACAPALGQVLTDPTQPPAALVQGPARIDSAPAATSAPRLQSILIATGAHSRRVAVIDGITLRLGEKFKGAELVSVNDNEVVLQRGRERQVLTLNPAPEQQVAPAVRPGADQQ